MHVFGLWKEATKGKRQPAQTSQEKLSLYCYEAEVLITTKSLNSPKPLFKKQVWVVFIQSPGDLYSSLDPVTICLMVKSQYNLSFGYQFTFFFNFRFCFVSESKIDSDTELTYSLFPFLLLGCLLGCRTISCCIRDSSPCGKPSRFLSSLFSRCLFKCFKHLL